MEDKLVMLEQLAHYDERIKQYISENSASMMHCNTTEFWNSQVDLVGEKDHIYIYTDYSTIEKNGKTIDVPNIKIGDGSAFLIDNPFITTSIDELLKLHINDSAKHIGDGERDFWNNKVRCYLNNENSETIIFTTN